VICRRLWLRRALLLAVALVFTGIVGFWLLPRLLIKAEINPLPAGDAIIQVAFDPESYVHVRDLYRRGLGRKVVCASSQFSPGEFIADYSRLSLVELGVAANDIEVQHLPLASCLGEVLPELIGLVQKRGWKTVLFVVHPEESRAVGRFVPRAFAASGIRATVTYSEDSRRELVDGWWRTHRKAQRIVAAAFETALDACYSRCR
jgi:hypothetical protein